MKLTPNNAQARAGERHRPNEDSGLHESLFFQKLIGIYLSIPLEFCISISKNSVLLSKKWQPGKNAR